MKILFLIFLLAFLNQTYAASGDILSTCSYKQEIEKCLKANQNWTTRAIEDFICINSFNQIEIAWQIILDKEFKKNDKEIEKYLKWLEDNKSYYFWPSSKESFLKAVDDIEEKFSVWWEYWKKYAELCDPTNNKSILSKTFDCFENWVPNTQAQKYFFTQTECSVLVATKLEIYKQVAYDILKLNKNQVKKDEIKKYTWNQRTKYDKLLEIVMVNMWYMERIWKKWPSKSKNAKAK